MSDTFAFSGLAFSVFAAAYAARNGRFDEYMGQAACIMLWLYFLTK